MKKRVFASEAAYVAGLVILAAGTAFMELANFGMSMVVAPAYLFYLKLSPIFPAFTFGMAEYALQGVLLVLLIMIMRRVKRYYLFSFITAVLYGFTLDGVMAILCALPAGSFALRTAWYAIGLVLCSLGVALLVKTYIAPEVYELLVKEISMARGVRFSKVKTAYDCASCAAAIVLSFVFFGFGHFEGVKAGTIFCALINGTLIGAINTWLDARFDFADKLNLRRYFEA